jgi:hypothetical protein
MCPWRCLRCRSLIDCIGYPRLSTSSLHCRSPTIPELGPMPLIDIVLGKYTPDHRLGFALGEIHCQRSRTTGHSALSSLFPTTSHIPVHIHSVTPIPINYVIMYVCTEAPPSPAKKTSSISPSVQLTGTNRPRGSDYRKQETQQRQEQVL